MKKPCQRNGHCQSWNRYQKRFRWNWSEHAAYLGKTDRGAEYCPAGGGVYPCPAFGLDRVCQGHCPDLDNPQPRDGADVRCAVLRQPICQLAVSIGAIGPTATDWLVGTGGDCGKRAAVRGLVRRPVCSAFSCLERFWPDVGLA